MENKIIGLCSAIVENESFSLYSAIAQLFQEFGYTDGYINTLQAIYDITGNNSYLTKIGDYFRDIGQNEIAFSYYNKCFKSKNPDLYKRFEQTKPNAYFIQEFRTQFENDKVLIKLINRNVVLIHLLKFALDYGLKELVLMHSQKINIIADMINKHLETSHCKYGSTIKNATEIQEVLDDYSFLSKELANIKHHNDINKLAIELNPNNHLAYFNIIDDYIVYNQPYKALDYYNSVYSGYFKVSELNNLEKLYNVLQRFYNSIGDYYKTVYYQKLSLEERVKS